MTVAVFATGLQDTACTFGSTQSLEMSKADFGTFTVAKFALSFWFYRDGSTSGNQYVYGIDNTSDLSALAFYVLFDLAGKMRFRGALSGSFNGDYESSSTYSVAEQAWHHVLIHYDAANGISPDRLKVWVDGSEDTTGTYTYPTSTTGVNSSGSGIRLIGAGNLSGVASDNWEGDLYQVAMFDNYLPAIGDVYNSGAVSILGVPNKKFFLPFKKNIVGDQVLSTEWTNNNSVTTTTNRP